MFRGQHHGACDHFIVKWKSKSDGSYSLRYLDFILANADIDGIVKFKKLAVSSFIDLILGDFAGSIGFP